MPVAMALLRDVHNLCPKEVLTFILDLIKYNDNRKNKVRYLSIIKVASDILFLKKYLDCEIIVVSIVLEIYRERNIQTWFIIISTWKPRLLGF